MRAILVASSPINTFEKLYRPIAGDLIIGIDGGCDKIKSYSIDIAYGDFDSLGCQEILKNIKKVKKYPIQKDETDLELAITDLKEQVSEILIYNATGGRLDHFLATFKLLERFKDLKISIIDEYNVISVVQDGNYQLLKDDYQYFSLIPIEDTLLTIRGALYNIEEQLVKKTDTYTVSNQVLDNTEIKIHQGLMYLIKSKDA